MRMEGGPYAQLGPPFLCRQGASASADALFHRIAPGQVSIVRMYFFSSTSLAPETSSAGTAEKPKNHIYVLVALNPLWMGRFFRLLRAASRHFKIDFACFV